MNTLYLAKSYEHLLGTPGFSDPLLKNHFTLYEGYVKNTNALLAAFETFEREGRTGTPEWSEIRRRFGWEWNGMRLHELYFGNMKNGGTPLAEDGPLAKAIRMQWGSSDAWLKDFKMSGAMRGIGWVILARDKDNGQLLNIWVNEHDVGNLAGAAPVLVMDVFEHAFMLDYGLKRADYIEAFMKAIDWGVVTERFDAS